MINQAATLDDNVILWAQEKTDSPALRASQADCLLARRIAAGDMQAFEELYQLYHSRVYRLCLRMTNNPTEAEDLTQEIFLHVYRKIGSFRGESAMMTWLHRVSVNKVLMHFRSSTVRREKMTEDGSAPEPAMRRAKSHDQVLAVDRLALDKAIAQLPPGYRAVLLLHDVEGYEHTEIARMMGTAVGTSKSQLHKARIKVRALLKGNH